ncbi:syntaxin binding protein 1 [Malassezia yamatoensis]|uniref:Syntaxin binding protein 1 n=1 Tax=Malassezia yamatoensis TaxID=253288 RepID=A0AAJ6CHZ9_9BASI|nr:syntaxin binding protein 1 [Malassezia yamatoensis]
MQLLSGVMRMFDILEQNVTKVENIEKRRDAQPEMEAAYLLCATTQNVDRLIRELAPKGDTPPQYAAGHVFFVDAVSDQLVDKLTKSEAAPRIKQLSDLFLNLTPTESQVFDLKRSSALFALYQPMEGPYAPGRDEALAMLQEELDISAESLVNLCITLNENPIIRYHAPTPTPLGPLAEEAHQDSIDGAARIPPAAKKTKEVPGSIEIGQHFTQQLAFRVQAALDEYTRDGQMLGEPGRPQSVLLITDRSMDLVAPFLHEFTYQAMINDLLPIEDGLKYKHTYTNAEGQSETTVAELNDQDEIYVAIRHLHIVEAIANLTRQFNVHIGEASEFSSKTSIDGMRDMLASLPHMKSTKEKLSLHLSLAQQCMDRFEKSKLTDQATVEQNSATGETAQGGKPRNLVEEMVPLLDDPQISNPDKVRIIALYIMFCDGVHDEDRKRLFQHARLGHGEMTAVNNMVNLGVRIVRESSNSTLDVIFRKKRKQLKTRSGSFNYDVSRYQPLIRTMIEDHLMNRLDQTLFPYVRDAPSEQSATGSLSPRSMSSFSNSATDMASSMLQSAIFATGGKDSPLARVGRFDASSGRSTSVSGTSGISSTSLRSAKPTWHQKGRSQSVVTLASDNPSRKHSVANMDQGSATAQRVLVFVAGGMTYSEARTAYEVSTRNHVDVYIGASQTFTPLKFMEAMRVMGSSRQPPPSESYIAARRAAQAQQDARKKQADANLKKINKETLPPPVYPQTLSPQQRYDLRYETHAQAEPEPSNKQSSATSSAAANARKISDKLNPRSKNDTSQDLRQAAPAPTAESGVRRSSEVPSVPQRSKMRDMSKFKNPFSFRK